jgi:dipeptidyl aminopeptidase/acylaminoacyl peptidase
MRHSYGSDPHQFSVLRMPPGDGPHPVAVLIHGGFWRDRYALDLMEPLSADLVARGWATWNVEYRRLGSGGGFPRTTDDVAAAIDALAALDAPLDLDRVVAIGHSAGGHLALWAAGRRDARVPLAGAVGQGAVSDLEEAQRLGLSDGVVAQFVGAAPLQAPERYREASPIARVPTGVPVLLVHGEADDRVPASLTDRYAGAARAAGDDVEVVLRSGEGHFEHLDPGAAAWQAVLTWLERWRAS